MTNEPRPDFPQTPTPDEPGSMWEGETPTPDTPAAGGRGRKSAGSRGGAKRRTTTSGAKSSPRAGSGDAPPRPTGGSARDLKTRLEELFGGMALLPMAAGDHYSAHIIATRSGHLAEAWSDLAKQNPAVKRVLEGMLQGGAWGAVIMSTGAVVVPILGHYGFLPPVDPWAGLYGPAPVQQGVRARQMPPARPAPAQGPAPAPPGPPIPGYPTAPDNPRANGAGTPATNSDGTVNMTPPIAPGQPPGVVTVAGSRAAAPPTPDITGPPMPDAGHTEGGPMTPPIAPGQPEGIVTVAGSRNRAG